MNADELYDVFIRVDYRELDKLIFLSSQTWRIFNRICFWKHKAQYDFNLPTQIDVWGKNKEWINPTNIFNGDVEDTDRINKTDTPYSIGRRRYVELATIWGKKIYTGSELFEDPAILLVRAVKNRDCINIERLSGLTYEWDQSLFEFCRTLKRKKDDSISGDEMLSYSEKDQKLLYFLVQSIRTTGNDNKWRLIVIEASLYVDNLDLLTWALDHRSPQISPNKINSLYQLSIMYGILLDLDVDTKLKFIKIAIENDSHICLNFLLLNLRHPLTPELIQLMHYKHNKSSQNRELTSGIHTFDKSGANELLTYSQIINNIKYTHSNLEDFYLEVFPVGKSDLEMRSAYDIQIKELEDSQRRSNSEYLKQDDMRKEEINLTYSKIYTIDPDCLKYVLVDWDEDRMNSKLKTLIDVGYVPSYLNLLSSIDGRCDYSNFYRLLLSFKEKNNGINKEMCFEMQRKAIFTENYLLADMICQVFDVKLDIDEINSFRKNMNGRFGDEKLMYREDTAKILNMHFKDEFDTELIHKYRNKEVLRAVQFNLYSNVLNRMLDCQNRTGAILLLRNILEYERLIKVFLDNPDVWIWLGVKIFLTSFPVIWENIENVIKILNRKMQGLYTRVYSIVEAFAIMELDTTRIRMIESILREQSKRTHVYIDYHTKIQPPSIRTPIIF